MTSRVTTDIATLLASNGTGNITATILRTVLTDMFSAYPYTVNVKDYGAKGDGVTDDTTSIAAAITTGSTIWVPDGTYITTVQRLGVNQTILLSPGAILKLKAGASDGRVVSMENNGSKIVGGTVDGNRANVTGATSAAISLPFTTISNATIDSVQVQNCGAYGIGGFCDATNLIVRNCYVHHTTNVGIYINMNATNLDRVEILDCTVDRSAEPVGTSFDGIYVVGAFNDVVVARNRVLLPVGLTANAAGYLCIEVGVDGRTCLRALVANNITNGGGMGLSLANIRDLTVAGNLVYQPTENGIEIAASQLVSCTGNAVYGNSLTQQGINIDGDIGGQKNVTVTGNMCRDCFSIAIFAISATNLVIADNICVLNTTISNWTGIDFNGCTQFAVSGNLIDGLSSTSSTGLTLANSYSGTIASNEFRRITGNAINIFATTAITVDHISITGCNFESDVGTPVATSMSGGAALGNNMTVIGCTGFGASGNASRGDCLDYLNQVFDFVGTGSPASSVTASPGSTYRNRSGGGSTTLYVKETGAGNTGWVAK